MSFKYLSNLLSRIVKLYLFSGVVAFLGNSFANDATAFSVSLNIAFDSILFWHLKAF